MMFANQIDGESVRKSCGRRASQVKNRGNGEKKTGCVPVIQINNVEVDDRGTGPRKASFYADTACRADSTQSFSTIRQRAIIREWQR